MNNAVAMREELRSAARNSSTLVIGESAMRKEWNGCQSLTTRVSKNERRWRQRTSDWRLVERGQQSGEEMEPLRHCRMIKLEYVRALNVCSVTIVLAYGWQGYRYSSRQAGTLPHRFMRKHRVHI
jgi:hypothetical protein